MKLFPVALLTFIMSLSTFVSCTSGGSTGPCEYTEEKFRMTIVDVQPTPEDSSIYVVLVDFDGNIPYAEDTHTFEEIRNVKTTRNFVFNNHIEVGNIYRGILHQVVEGTGNCDKEIFEWETGFNN